MTLEQVILTMINDKMLDNGQISEKLHSSIQKDIITLSMSVPVTVTVASTGIRESSWATPLTVKVPVLA